MFDMIDSLIDRFYPEYRTKNTLKESIAAAEEAGYVELAERGRAVLGGSLAEADDYNMLVWAVQDLSDDHFWGDKPFREAAIDLAKDGQGLSFLEIQERINQLRKVRQVEYDLFSDLDTLTLDTDSIDKINLYGVEVGGFIVPSREGKDGKLELTFEAEGSKTGLSFKGYPNESQLGKWHLHPFCITKYGLKPSYPIPSGMDLFPSLFGGHMMIDIFPHLIVAPGEARLYFPEVLSEVVSEGLRERIVPYSTKDRALELITKGFFPYDRVLKDEMPPGMAYISFEV